MVKIRLKRLGAKARPFYRVVAADSKSPRDGRFIETLGTYDPLTNPPSIKLKADRVAYWIGTGAQPTDSAKSVLKTAGLLDEKGKVKPAPQGVAE